MDLSVIAVLFGMSTIWVFLYKRDWLLQKLPSLILLIVNFGLFILAYILQYLSVGNPKLIIFLKMGFLAQLIFLLLVSVFRMVYYRDPVETFWTMDIKLMKDGIFNFVFWVGGIIIPAILISIKVL